MSKTAKVVYGCFFFNILLLIGITTKRHVANKKAETFYTHKIIDSKNENNDWRCYNIAKQYRYECAYLNEEEEEQLKLCKTLGTEIENCRDNLYQFIKDETPAMKPISNILNKPDWVKDPQWFQNLQNKK